MIRRAKISEIPDILIITQACAKKMQANGIFQWNEHYPSKEAFIKDIEREELFVIEENKTVLGTIVISTLMDEEYKPIKQIRLDNSEGTNIIIKGV